MGFTNGRPVLRGQSNYTFHTVASLLGDANEVVLKESRMQVKLVKKFPQIQMVLGETPIVTHHADGGFILDNGGWNTRITMSRMNEFMPPGYQVYQSDHFWYLDSPHGKFPFARGMQAGPVGVFAERASWPQHAVYDGKRYPMFTIPEYMDRAYTTLAWWVNEHIAYTYPRHKNNPGVRRWGEDVRNALLYIADLFDNMQTAVDGTDLFTSAMSMNHLIHATPAMFGNQNGTIVNDYGRGRGLRRRVVQLVSDGADRYFGQPEIDKFMRLEKRQLPPLPIYTWPSPEEGDR